MQLFFGHLQGENILIDAEEGHHLAKVLRKSPGDIIHVIVNDDNFYECTLTEVGKKVSVARVIKVIPGKSNPSYQLHMFVSPTKNIDRFEWFLEKATEIGISEVTPILTKHSERKNIKLPRLEKILLSAAKQSHKTKVPVIHEMISFTEAMKRVQNGYFAHCVEGEKTPLKNVEFKEETINIFVGPEGDFSEKEIEIANLKGLKMISLGKSRLRTETAGIAAVHTLSLLHSED